MEGVARKKDGVDDMAQVFLGLGSNLGERASTITKAIQALSALPGTTLVRASSVYETEPWGKHDQPSYLNAVAEMATDLEPHDLLKHVLVIEEHFGRTRKERWGARTLDIDLLLYDDLTISDATLTIPHPHMHERRFVLVPLIEIAPDVVDPRSGFSWREIEEICKDASQISKHRLDT